MKYSGEIVEMFFAAVLLGQMMARFFSCPFYTYCIFAKGEGGGAELLSVHRAVPVHYTQSFLKVAHHARRKHTLNPKEQREGVTTKNTPRAEQT